MLKKKNLWQAVTDMVYILQSAKELKYLFQYLGLTPKAIEAVTSSYKYGTYLSNLCIIMYFIYIYRK